MTQNRRPMTCGPSDVLTFHEVLYQPNNMVVAVCGGVDAKQVIRIAEDLFSTKTVKAVAVPPRTPPVFQPGSSHHNRPTGMFHVYIGTDAPTAAHDDRIPLEVANSILGDGTFSDAGLWLTYAGIAPENADTVIGLIRSEFDRMLSEPIPANELNLAKAKLRGHLILGLESNGHRASRLANAVLQRRDIRSPDELLVRLDAVTCDSAHEALSTYLQPDRLNITTVGPSA